MIDWFQKTSSLTHQMIEERKPFYVTEVEHEGVWLTLTLTNSDHEKLEINPYISWEVTTPTDYFTHWDDLDRVVEFERVKLIGVSGYENFFSNTYIFENGYMLRNLKTNGGYPDPEPWGIALTTEQSTFITCGIDVMDMRELLPIRYRTNSLNPFDRILSPAYCERPELIGALINAVEYFRVEDSIRMILALVLTLKDGRQSSLVLKTHWALSSENTIRCVNDNEDSVTRQHLKQLLTGQEIIGFAGSRNIHKATIFFTGGLRLDQEP